MEVGLLPGHRGAAATDGRLAGGGSRQERRQGPPVSATRGGRCLGFRDWSLIMGGGGLQNGKGEACEVLPLRKRAMMKGWHKKFWGSFYALA